jgi:hypothetical protein
MATTSSKSGNASITEIGRLRARPDPIMEFKWVVTGEVPFSSGAYADPYDGGSYSYAVDYTYIESVGLPFNNVDTTEIFCGSGYTTFPGFHKIGGFSLNVYADSNGNSLKWLMAWKSKVKNFSNGVYGLPGDYKRDLQVQMLDSKNNPIFTHTLIRVWPTQTNEIALGNDSQGRLVLSQAFALDDMKIAFNK